MKTVKWREKKVAVSLSPPPPSLPLSLDFVLQQFLSLLTAIPVINMSFRRCFSSMIFNVHFRIIIRCAQQNKFQTFHQMSQKASKRTSRHRSCGKGAVENGSARHIFSKGRERDKVSQTNTGTVSKAVLGKPILRDGIERVWVLPSTYIPS